MHWYCETCRQFFDVATSDVSARLELHRMRAGHEAWHRELAAAAEVAL